MQRKSKPTRRGGWWAAFAVLAFALWRLNQAPPDGRNLPLAATAPEAAVTEAEVSDEAVTIASGEPPGVVESLDLVTLGRRCVADLSAHYAQGRLLKLQVNRKTQFCNALLETDVGSDRYFGVQWWAQDASVRPLGEVRLPEVYLAAGALPAQTLSWDAVAARDLAQLPLDMLGADSMADYDSWAAQVVWMPAPFERAVWMLGADNAQGFNWYMDVADSAEADQVLSTMPALAEDLEDPTSSPLVVADRSADKAMLQALEGGGAEPGTVYASAQTCANALAGPYVAWRALRVHIDAAACRVVLADVIGGTGVRLLQITTVGVEDLGAVEEQGEAATLPNYPLDPAWLGAQALAERLLRARIAETPAALGVAWNAQSHDVVWQVRPTVVEAGPEVLYRFDREGQPVEVRFARAPGDTLGDSDAPEWLPVLQ